MTPCDGQRTLRPLLAALLILGPYASKAPAAVLLVLSRSSAPVAPGDAITFQVRLEITGAEQITGFDYYLGASGGGSNADFTIFERVSQRENFADLNNSDEAVSTLPASLLDSVNGLSLGASVADPFQPVAGTGSYLIANFTLLIEESTGAGDYLLRPVFANWFDQNFEAQNFATAEALRVTVVPEPSPSLFLAVTCLAVMISRTRRSLTSHIRGHSLKRSRSCSS